jgi:hypothetical protein
MQTPNKNMLHNRMLYINPYNLIVHPLNNLVDFIYWLKYALHLSKLLVKLFLHGDHLPNSHGSKIPNFLS